MLSAHHDLHALLSGAGVAMDEFSGLSVAVVGIDESSGASVSIDEFSGLPGGAVVAIDEFSGVSVAIGECCGVVVSH